jgi:hypothetical protein
MSTLPEDEPLSFAYVMSWLELQGFPTLEYVEDCEQPDWLPFWPRSLHARFLSREEMERRTWAAEKRRREVLPWSVLIKTRYYAETVDKTIYEDIYQLHILKQAHKGMPA